jgi:uncharacterized protein
MILIDANLLIYAVNTEAPLHPAAKTWVEETMNGARGQVGLPWISLVAFVRITSHPKLLRQPRRVEESLATVAEWLALPAVEVLNPGPDHAVLFEAACRSCGGSGNLITDAHLAALAMEHGCELASCDTDFGKFPGLHWINPLAP